MDKLIVIGGGGHAKVVLEILRAMNRFEVVGVLDPAPARPHLLGVPVLGGDSRMAELRAEGVTQAFVALGDNRLRRRLAASAAELGFGLPAAVHSGAIVSRSAAVGAGAAVMAGAVLNADVRVGDLAIVNTGAVIDHDCRLGAGAHVGPGSALAAKVDVGDDAFLGVGVRAIPGVRIGARATVGAGSVVVRDIPEEALAYGVPARLQDRHA